jgi:hypothetical protein
LLPKRETGANGREPSRLLSMSQRGQTALGRERKEHFEFGVTT